MFKYLYIVLVTIILPQHVVLVKSVTIVVIHIVIARHNGVIKNNSETAKTSHLFSLLALYTIALVCRNILLQIT